jgi:hypothetical protein
LRALFLGFAITLWPLLADAQRMAGDQVPQAPEQQTPPQAAPAQAQPAQPPAAPAQAPAADQATSTRETLNEIAKRHEELAKLLDPGQYPPAFELGAQAAYLAPAAGVSSIVFGYDAIWMQVNLDVGVGFGGDPARNTDANNVYSFDLRVAAPIHRGVRADFSLVAGGGASLVDPPRGANYTLGIALAGAQLRVFQTPNVALTGVLGFAALLRSDQSFYIVGAKPLGSASIVYFFR